MDGVEAVRHGSHSWKLAGYLNCCCCKHFGSLDSNGFAIEWRLNVKLWEHSSTRWYFTTTILDMRQQQSAKTRGSSSRLFSPFGRAIIHLVDAAFPPFLIAACFAELVLQLYWPIVSIYWRGHISIKINTNILWYFCFVLGNTPDLSNYNENFLFSHENMTHEESSWLVLYYTE